MALNETQLRELIDNPRESLAIELKNWINPDSPKDIAKIIKTSLAMRNNDGGLLLVGFNDKDGSPDFTGAPASVEEVFHTDKIQGYISKYSSEPFEVTLYYPEKNDVKFVVIEIPQGVKSPVAAKSELMDNNKALIKSNQVYTRTLLSNNTPSTSEAIWKDWPQLVEKCFENREADIGRFFRRHLLSASQGDLKEAISSLFLNEASGSKVNGERSSQFLEASYARFQKVIDEKQVSLPSHGAMEVVAIINGEIDEYSASGDFLNLLFSTNPSYTGWPVWIDSRFFLEEARPFVNDGVWETCIAFFGNDFVSHLDFWRLSPSGSFYLYRAFQDDIGGGENAPKPCTTLEFGLAILRATECIAVALAFAKAMGCQDDATIQFVFRWSGLKGRKISSWANPYRFLSHEGKAYQDKVETKIEIPVDTAKEAISGFVHQIVSKLFEAFDGFVLTENITDDFVRKLTERRL